MPLTFLLRVNKLFYSLSGSGGSEGGGGEAGRCCGDTEREGARGSEREQERAREQEKEVKSVLRNVPGQASG